jgi:hypothetical protein
LDSELAPVRVLVEAPATDVAVFPELLDPEEPPMEEPLELPELDPVD